MSTHDLKNMNHYSKLAMRPFTRTVILGMVGYIGYWIFSEPIQVEHIRPNYNEYRRLKGLPEVPLKHPGPFGCMKEMRIIPKEEAKEMRN